jgi:glycosyltransferase involved in cell wall biosynthesis
MTASQQRLTLRAHLDIHSGYGEAIRQTFERLTNRGIFVTLRPLGINEFFGQTLPPMMRAHIQQIRQPEPFELLFAPPTNHPTPERKTVFYTMWESTILPRAQVAFLNRSAAAVVPCDWCKTSFEASGVKVPIHVVPLGFDPDAYTPQPLPSKGPLVFGVAGRVKHCPKRKGVQEVIDAFLKAFPNIEDVRLHVKIHPDDPIKCSDPRVKIFRDVLEPYQLANWLHGLSALISFARAEGYGLWPLYALACGRPVIACHYSGHADFLNKENSFPIPFREAQVDGVGDSNVEYDGLWAEPNVRQAIEIMQSVHRRRQLLIDKAPACAPSVAHLTWEKSVDKLIGVLQSVGALADMGDPKLSLIA